MQHRSPVHSHLCSELVDIITAEGAAPSKVPGNLEEIGEWSALVLTETAIERGTFVRVAFENQELTGVVESCAPDQPLGFFVEVRLHPESRWSEQWFTPRHLLSLSMPKAEVFTLVRASGY